MVSVAFPAFLLGHEPWRRIFAISYGGELSDKHSGDFRSIVDITMVSNVPFPKCGSRAATKMRSITTERGFRKSTTVMGALTGLGGDIFIIDDPQKAEDAQSESRRNTLNHWFSNTLMSRLDNKETGAIIVVMQRVHIEDLSGYLIDSSADWTVLSLPAIAEVEEKIPVGDGKFITSTRPARRCIPARESLATLRKHARLRSGRSVFSAQYQQSPVPPGGAMIKRDWLRYYDDASRAHVGADQVIQSWDTAAKGGAHNCWSVCTTWLLRDKHYYLLDVTRGRYEYPRLRATARRAG